MGDVLNSIVAGVKASAGNMANIASGKAALAPIPPVNNGPTQPASPYDNLPGGDPLAALLNPGAAPAAELSGAAVQPAGTPLAVNSVAQQDNPYGVNAPNSAQDLAQIGSTDQSSPEAITVAGDRFTPKKQSVLEQVADFFLGGRLSHTVHEQNMRAALKGLTNPGDPNDPQNQPGIVQAIRRVETFDPTAAYKMYTNLQDDKRADLATDSLVGNRQDKALTPLRATLGAIQAMPEEKRALAYQTMLPSMIARRDRLNIPEEEFPLPEQYDDTTVSSLYQGGIAPSAQERLKQGAARLAETSDYHHVLTSQGNQKIELSKERIMETGRHDRMTEAQGATRIGQSAERLSRPDPATIITESTRVSDKDTGKSKTVNQKYPNGFIQYSPDKKRARKNEGGSWRNYMLAPDGKYHEIISKSSQ